MDGLLLVDKPSGVTSHDVVQQLRRALRQKKIGHCGTLDPDATGLLLITLGRATRLTRFLIRAPKVYEGTIRFGSNTDTYDAAGQATETFPLGDLSPERIDPCMAELEGTYLQIPPPYCAKKIKGVKYYELARRGEEVPLEPKEVTVYEFSRTDEPTEERVSFRLGCSSGTYARTLAFDLGGKLGCGGHLEVLRRTQIGSFSLDDAVTIEELVEQREKEPDGDVPGLIPFDAIPLPFPEVTADRQQEERIVHGQTVLVRELDGEEGDWIKVLDQRHRFIAVGTVVERIGNGPVGIVQPRIVFQQS